KPRQSNCRGFRCYPLTSSRTTWRSRLERPLDGLQFVVYPFGRGGERRFVLLLHRRAELLDRGPDPGVQVGVPLRDLRLYLLVVRPHPLDRLLRLTPLPRRRAVDDVPVVDLHLPHL